MSEATKTPWRVLGGDRIIGPADQKTGGELIAACYESDRSGNEDEANAALIVRCVNAHEPLMEAAKAAMDLLPQGEYVEGAGAKSEAVRIRNQLRAALALAGEGE